MIVVCTCGQKNRVRIARAGEVRCGKCRELLADEVARQAERNAKIVLDLAAILAAKKKWTPEDERLAQLMTAHEKGGQ